MNSPIVGFQYLISGFGLITKPGIRRFVIIPLIINFFVFIGFFFLFRHYMSEFNSWVSHLLPTWLQWLSVILWFLFLISFFLFFIYLFVIVGNIIAAPFNGFLSEKVELYLTGSLPEERSLMENIKDIPRILGRQLSIILYYLPRAIFILILFFIPIVHFIAAFFWFLFSAWFMTLSFIDYPTDNHRVPMTTVREWLRERQFTALGFGAGVLIISMIPILNFVIMPAAVAAATRFWVEERKT